MRLRCISIQNFRSVARADGDPVDLALSDHGNYLAGPNNCGKSNILRAVQLALSPETLRYDPDRDLPISSGYAFPSITLEFAFTSMAGQFATLRDMARDYERSVQNHPGATFAEEGILRFNVQYRTRPDSRGEMILARGTGERRGDEELLEKLLRQFHQVVRFVSIESGEDLTSLLQRGFVESLKPALEAKDASYLRVAREHRDSYVSALRENVLAPLADHVSQRVAEYIPDVQSVELLPVVERLEDAIAKAEFRVADNFPTSLGEKGTGVRGAVILALMSFIAESSNRAVVFGIEEPEAFLHPATHPALGEGLERFTDKPTVSLMVTTHSPFIFRSGSKANVFAISKTAVGHTLVDDIDERRAAVTQARELLLGSGRMPTMVDLIDEVPSACQLVLVVEGFTDKFYLELATRNSQDALLAGIHIVAAVGADDAATKAIVLHQAFQKSPPVVALFDDDEPGRVARDLLVSKLKKLKFQNRKDVWQYSEWVKANDAPVEAEDLFPKELLEAFHTEMGDSVLAEKVRRADDAGWHYGFTQNAKGPFMTWLEANAVASDFSRWVMLLTTIRQKHGLTIEEGE